MSHNYDHHHDHHHDHDHHHSHHPTHTRRQFIRLTAISLATTLLNSCINAPPPPSNPAHPPVATTLPTSSPLAISPTNTPSPPATTSPIPTTNATATPNLSPTAGFDAFRDQLNLITTNDYLLIEANGLPSHNMMVGISSWQQQVPVPQPYTGDNAWQLPLNPTLADNPISAQTNLYRGAIAIAVNGVPIFNALNNRGEDAFLAGELDNWGGHCGRADDYHYHTAPLHLQEIVGPTNPIAYALDGFPIYGLTEPDGSPVTNLDQFNGHLDANGHYHYHASNDYPYINGGLRGTVTVQNDQIEPQPRLRPFRPAGEPLRGATITNFTMTGTNAYSLEYTLNNQKHYVNYSFAGSTYTFTFIDAAGATRTETYTR
ncbi:MAG TPA: YHYH protein [Anaerolineae bacterium]|nr:YHYH protein [Anaerolineae bacterium]